MRVLVTVARAHHDYGPSLAHVIVMLTHSLAGLIIIDTNECNQFRVACLPMMLKSIRPIPPNLVPKDQQLVHLGGGQKRPSSPRGLQRLTVRSGGHHSGLDMLPLLARPVSGVTLHQREWMLSVQANTYAMAPCRSVSLNSS